MAPMLRAYLSFNENIDAECLANDLNEIGYEAEREGDQVAVNLQDVSEAKDLLEEIYNEDEDIVSINFVRQKRREKTLKQVEIREKRGGAATCC